MPVPYSFDYYSLQESLKSGIVLPSTSFFLRISLAIWDVLWFNTNLGLFDLFYEKYQWSHVNSLYILEIKPLSHVSLANVFSHTVGSLFILLIFSLATQKLFTLMYSHWIILSFISLALGDILLIYYCVRY